MSSEDAHRRLALHRQTGNKAAGAVTTSCVITTVLRRLIGGDGGSLSVYTPT